MKVNVVYGFLLLVGLISPVRLSAQEKKPYTRAEMDSIVNPALMEKGEDILRFDSCVQHIGKMSDMDAPRVCRFAFRNVSREAVRIAKVHTSCGCTAAEFPRQSIAPGEESVITLAYNPKNRIGTVDTQAFVYTEASAVHPVARLTLLGEVTASDEWDYLPYAMGILRVKRTKITFKEVGVSNRPSERILCANAGNTPLKLSARMLPPYASFRTEPEVILPGKEADLVITIDGSQLSSSQPARFTPKENGNSLCFSLWIEGVETRPTDRMIQVRVERSLGKKK